MICAFHWWQYAACYADRFVCRFSQNKRRRVVIVPLFGVFLLLAVALGATRFSSSLNFRLVGLRLCCFSFVIFARLLPESGGRVISRLHRVFPVSVAIPSTGKL